MIFLNKKVVIWGRGSIGIRHYKNLISLGYDVYFLRRNPKKKNEIEKKQLEELNPSFCIICTPTALHLKNAIFCLEKKIPTYIDKPLGYKEKKSQIKKLEKFSKKITIHGGFNLKYCKELNLFINKIKKKKNYNFAQFVWKTDMRKWHPWENYKKSYAFKKNLGGGVIHTCSHEINIMRDFFDEVKFESLKKIYKEGICSAYDAYFKSKNTIININIDFMSKKKLRFVKFSDKKKEYIFDFYKFDYKKINDYSYISSIKDFISCIKKRGLPKSNFKDALNTYKILEKLNNE